MSIRDVLSARRRKLLLLGFGAWLGLVLIAASGRRMNPPWLAIPFIAAFVAAILLNYYWLRCPRCNGPIGIVNAPLSGRGGWFRRRVDFCPFCGVSLDED